MNHCKRIVCTLLAVVVLLGAVPALAAERTELPDYFSVETDAVQTPGQFTLTEGRILGGGIDGGLANSITVGDDFYYALEAGSEITVTNTNPSPTGFVYLYCTVFHPQDSYVSYTGETIEIPGGYFRELDTNGYYLGEDGQWLYLDDAHWLLGAVMDETYRPGRMLFYGESCSFTLPDGGEDAAYLLHFFYLDPAVTDYETTNANYTEWQRNVYMVAPAATDDTAAGFADVPADAYYADAVAWAVEAGVTSGTSATAFSPDASVTRAQAVTFLWRAAGSPKPASLTSDFSDVTDPNAYYYQAVLWAAEQGITNGTGDGVFGLNGTLPYDQILAFLCRAAGGDASGADWSEKALAWAAENGLTDGLSFTAAGTCPRSDVVYCLWKQLA